MVVNGATKYGDMGHFDAQLTSFRSSGGDVAYEYLHTQNLVALQASALRVLGGGILAVVCIRMLCLLHFRRAI